MKNTLLVCCLLIMFGCEDDTSGGETNPTATPNILLIIADDMGKDATAGFSEGSVKPSTPNLDKIKNEGLSFNNFWVYPTCSPTRASMITGKYGYRTGVKWAGDELSDSETILQTFIKDETDNAYATAIVGKWHLSGNSSTVNPETFGMDYYAGLLSGGVPDYYKWQLTEDGSSKLQNGYITEVFTDLAIDWVADQSKPWFLWLAYNAPHTPFHVPPAEMHTQGDLVEYEEGIEPLPYYMAAIEAMDFQIGRFLERVSEDELDKTVIIFIGDNGTPNQVAQSPYSFSTAKGSLYQGGINVPMFVKGPGVSRIGEDDNLITSTDLFSTISELAGVSNSDINDSKSFVSLLSNESGHREFQYSEMNDGTKDLWTISNGEYKIIKDASGGEEMYHLESDPYENENLLNGILSSNEESIKIELESALEDIRN